MYQQGFEEGREYAIQRAFGYRISIPEFDSPQEQNDWHAGFESGYASID